TLGSEPLSKLHPSAASSVLVSVRAQTQGCAAPRVTAVQTLHNTYKPVNQTGAPTSASKGNAEMLLMLQSSIILTDIAALECNVPKLG
ncbi:uncharacterized, partial [Tachysurus ichikawai]